MIKHYMYMPLLGLGKRNRGGSWLKNRIKIMKQFVIPSLQAQTSKNFTLWISVRPQDRHDKQIMQLRYYMATIKEFRTVFTYSGLCFYDDKYEDQEAKSRLVSNLHNSIGELLDDVGEVESVYMTIQPSDDCYNTEAVEDIQKHLKSPKIEAVGYSRGYIANYLTKEVKNYDPKTNPPFYTIKFPRDIFTDPLKHAAYTAITKDCGKYKEGTPIPSHEYVGDALEYRKLNSRGFLVGTHGCNVSTYFNIPYATDATNDTVLINFGLRDVEKFKLEFSLRRWVMQRLPHIVRRKLRYYHEIISQH